LSARKDDYVQIRPNGDVELWVNIAKPPEWERPGIVYNIKKDAGLDFDPRFAHLADFVSLIPIKPEEDFTENNRMVMGDAISC
jgi:hypothetical protein